MPISDSEMYREAAEKALLEGNGIAVLEQRKRLEREFWEQMNAMPLLEYDVDDEARCLGMLLLSEIAKDKERKRGR
jgi:hypothetical protein